jgi:sirohydrochlorin cobaltochelatase
MLESRRAGMSMAPKPHNFDATFAIYQVVRHYSSAWGTRNTAVNDIPQNAGLLLVAHGTRDELGLAEIRILAAKVAAELAPRPVEIGFIELAEPTIGGAFDRLVERDVQNVRVVPLLLFAAGHAKADLPQANRHAAEAHKKVSITVAEPFGVNRRICSLSQRRFEEALSGRPGIAAEQTYWLLVGRGTSDPQAIAEFGRFAGHQAQRLNLPQFGCSFVAAAQPTIEAGLRRAVETAVTGVKRIVVQPHLLFRGAVLDEVHAAVVHWQAKCPSVDWVTCAHLGPEQELVDAVVERAIAPATHRAGIPPILFPTLNLEP